jgi:hypothetical protein
MMISILAMGVLAMSLTESRIVSYDEKHDQAYYLARSVVSTTERWIAANFNDRDAMKLVIPTAFGEGAAYVTESTLDSHRYNLRVWRDARSGYSDTIYIEATATFRDVSATAKLSLNETISGYNLFDDAIYSLGPFSNKSGTAITLYPQSPPPSVSTGATYNAGDTAKIDKAFYDKTDGSVNQGRVYDFKVVNPPDNVTFPVTISAAFTEWKNMAVLTEQNTIIAGNLEISGNTVWTIQNMDATNVAQDVHVVINGDVTIKKVGGNFPTIKPSHYNGGKIYIYIYGAVTCTNPDALLIEGDEGPAVNETSGPAIFLICNGIGDTIEIIGNPYIKAYVYAPKMTVNVGGTTDLYGAVISEHFGWNGNIGVHYVKPYSFAGSPFANMGLFDEKISINNQTWLIN